jgi:hypothetical protein
VHGIDSDDVSCIALLLDQAEWKCCAGIRMKMFEKILFVLHFLYQRNGLRDLIRRLFFLKFLHYRSDRKISVFVISFLRMAKKGQEQKDRE